jgi:hypothetical protein
LKSCKQQNEALSMKNGPDGTAIDEELREIEVRR